MKLPPFLARQLGPFPVVAWVVIVPAGLYLGYKISSGTVDSGDDEAEGDEAAAAPQLGLGGAYVAIDRAPVANYTQGPPADLDEWETAAVAYLIANGTPAMVAQSAVAHGRYGETLNAAECLAFGMVIAQFPPPDPVPAMDCQTIPTDDPVNNLGPGSWITDSSAFPELIGTFVPFVDIGKMPADTIVAPPEPPPPGATSYYYDANKNLVWLYEDANAGKT